MKNRQCILNLIDDSSVCAEIGVWKGDFAKQIITKKPKHLYLIDPWIQQKYDGRWYSIEQEKMDKIYQGVRDEFSSLENVSIIRDFSQNVNFEDNFFNIIYIDGNHSYEHVLADLNHFYKFMKHQSFITGDDFGWTDRHCNRGPAAAVKDFCQKKSLKYRTHGHQFIIEINKNRMINEDI